MYEKKRVLCEYVCTCMCVYRCDDTKTAVMKPKQSGINNDAITVTPDTYQRKLHIWMY